MSYNVGDEAAGLPVPEAIYEVLRGGEQADVLLVQDRPWRVKLDTMAAEFGYRYYLSGRESKHKTHLGILSRFPFADVAAIGFGAPLGRRGALCADVVLPDRPVRVCNVHLPSMSPVVKQSEKTGSFGRLIRALLDEVFGDSARSEAVREFLEWIRGYEGRSMVVGGDFNTFPLSAAIRRMRGSFSDAFREFGDYSQGTYVGLKAPIKPRIDYLFHTEDLRPVRAEVREQTAGDHYPVFAEFAVPPAPR